MATLPRELPAEVTLAAPTLHGLLAEFDTPEALLRATRRARAHGYRRLDAYTPFVVDGLSEALGFHTSALPLIGLFGGIAGALSGFGMQLLIHVTLLPINVGGRPLDSWPSFVPVTFEMAVLFSALSMLAGLLVLNGLPQPYHPVFNVAAFAGATRDRFFLCLEARDPLFELLAARAFVQGLEPREVTEVLA